MSARSEVEALIAESDAALSNNPIQQMNLIAGSDAEFNKNQVFTRLNATYKALLLLADKIDARS